MKSLHIRNILVPIDFSNNSLNALQTAVSIAKRHEAKIHLLYIDDIDYSLYTDNENIQAPTLPEYMKTLAQLAKSVINNDELRCSYSAESGTVTSTILKNSISLQMDIIVMGKTGMGAYSQEYAGTHALQVAEKSQVPVLIIPEEVTKYSFENILFPVRPLLSVPDKYDAIRSFILKNNPSITVLNLRNPDYENELHIIHRLSQLMEMKLKNDNVPFQMKYYFENNQFAEHIINTLSEPENKIDLLVVSSEMDKNNKQFHIEYFTQKLIHQCNIPMLIIYPVEAKKDKEIILEKLENSMALN